MSFQGFNHGDDTRGQSRRCLRFVEGHVGVDFLQARMRER
jgi:hypothetical protein